MPDPLTLAQVKHVAKLARLALKSEQLERHAGQLSAVLDHLATLAELDVTDAEPMAYPFVLTNRLDEDQVGDALPLARLLQLAPAVEGDFFAVPKVLGEGGGA
jgi:aspartyl-tRNA(Asn)/glutamyl-tRNA(Gln) amidotransferase subunit C